MKNVYENLPEIEGVEYIKNSSGKPTKAIVTLDFPLGDLNPPVDRLTFRRMKSKDTLSAEDETQKLDAGLALYAALGGVPVEVIHELDTDDLDRISEAVAPLMGKLAMQGLVEAKAQAKAQAKKSPGET